jgi:hypothetical protein
MHRERDRQAGGQTDRWTGKDRQTDRQTDRHKHSTCVCATECMVNLSMDAWLKEAINEGVVYDVAVL